MSGEVRENVTVPLICSFHSYFKIKVLLSFCVKEHISLYYFSDRCVSFIFIDQ
jgi:hypothetical protein